MGAVVVISRVGGLFVAAHTIYNIHLSLDTLGVSFNGIHHQFELMG